MSYVGNFIRNIGILLIAFPLAHGIILGALYIPVAIMLMGLILRGVAFDFRVKAGDSKKTMWDGFFFLGSLIASVSQGWMLGDYITGLKTDACSGRFSSDTRQSLSADKESPTARIKGPLQDVGTVRLHRRGGRGCRVPDRRR